MITLKRCPPVAILLLLSIRLLLAGVSPEADLGVFKTGPAQASAGSQITYTIEVVNNGPNTANNAALKDVIPSGTTFVSFTSPAGWACTTPSPGATGSVDCANSNFAANGDDFFALVVMIDPSTQPNTIITNVATVSEPTDPN